MAFAGAGTTNTLTKATFDNVMGNIINALDGAFSQVQEIQTFFAAHPDADFTAAAGGPGPTGYAAGDVTTMKSAYTDLDQLRTIYQGTANLVVAKDFRTFAKLISGTLVH
jgi:hypothetical protein